MNNEEIRISDLLLTIAKRWKLIVVMALVGCGLGLILNSISFVQGEYTSYQIRASAAIIPRTSTGALASGGNRLTSDDYDLGENMVDAVRYVLFSDRLLNEAIQRARLVSVEPRDIYNNLSIMQIGSTQILELTLWWMDESSGIELMNAILSAAQDILPETLMVGAVNTIDAPAAEFTPTQNNYTRIWGITSLAGLGIGFAIVIGEFLLRPTLMDPKAVEDDLGTELLGVIPYDHAYFKSKTNLLTRESAIDSTVEQNFASTAYILCNRLGSGKIKHHCIYITSAEEREGKSSVAANLAIQISDLEKKVLLIDLNLDNPSLGGMFLQNVDYSRTLNALYKGEATVQDAVVSLTGYLDLLPAVLERNAVNLDSALFDFIQKLAQNYEYVLIDTPALSQSSDMLRLNQVAEAVLFVIRYDDAPLPVVRDALDQLDKSGIRILGSVVSASKTMHSFRSWRDRPADLASKSMRDTAEESDLLLVPAMSSGGGEDGGNPSGAPDILDELTKDPFQKDALSDDEAMDALLRMGADGSWTQKPEEPDPQPEAPAEADMDSGERPAGTNAADQLAEPDGKPEVLTTVVPAPPIETQPAAPAPDQTAPEPPAQPAPREGKKKSFFGRSKNYKPKH